MNQLILSKEQRPLLLEMCKDLFPETKMTITKFSDGYKGHEIKYIENDDTFTVFDTLSKSPSIHLGLNQVQLQDYSIGYEQSIFIHWYELCMAELSMRLYNENYQVKMRQFYNKNCHIIDFLYKDFKENKDFNFIK